MWGPFDEVRLIVSRPVQSEIDNQKNKGSGRLGKKARTASSLFREIILDGTGCKEIQSAGPAVKLFIRPDLKPSTEVAIRLDYGERDDQLVGTAHGFQLANPDADVRVLTHDTGPMASAKMIGLAVAAVPDDWLLPPETTDEEKKLASLQRELSRLKKAEPEFKIACVNEKGEEVGRLDLEVVRYEPVPPDAVEELMGRLAERFPMATDFGQRLRMERESTHVAERFLGVKEVFTPASEREIADYQEKAYPEWRKRCEDILRGLHGALQRRAGPPLFRIAARNDGARPARDALITFEAKGDFEIRPPPYRPEGKRDKDGKQSPIDLPRPPQAPQGKWDTASGIWPGRAELAQIRALAGHFQNPDRLITPLLPHINPRTDPNEFYFKPSRPMMPGRQFSLECAQWRHGVEAETFTGEIYLDDGQEEIGAALECRIHAENLADPATHTVPVRIEVQRVSTTDTAKSLVDTACRRTIAEMVSEGLKPPRG